MKPLMLSPEEERARLVLEALKRHRGLSDAAIAADAGYPNHQAVHARRSGVTRIGLSDIERLSRVLDVSREVFFMEPAEAVRWVLDHPEGAATPRMHVLHALCHLPLVALPIAA